MWGIQVLFMPVKTFSWYSDLLTQSENKDIMLMAVGLNEWGLPQIRSKH